MIKTIKTELGKYYQTNTELLPSVNTIIKNTRDEEKQEKLQEWRDKTVNFTDKRDQIFRIK